MLSACSRSPELESVRWTAWSSNQAPELLKLQEWEAHTNESVLVKESGSLIRRGELRRSGAIVEGSWFQTVRSSSGDLLSYSGEWTDEDLSIFDQQILSLSGQSLKILEDIRRQYPEFNKAHEVFDVNVILRKEGISYSPYLRVQFLAENEIQALEYLINAQGRLRQRREIGYHMIEGTGTVFPESPLNSAPVEKGLPNLIGNGTLTSLQLQVLSQLGTSAFSPIHIFNYRPDEKTFDEVQAFFFASRTMDWFSNILGIHLPYRLEIKVHMGGGKPSDAMFYYRGQVRLGEGDGISTRGIPRDPTIVAHETAHAYVEHLSKLPFEGEGGSYSEAFSDIFSALVNDEPKMGSYAYFKVPYKRSLENSKIAWKDFTGKKYADSEIISGTFWDLRKQVGVEKTARLAKFFLSHVGAGGKFENFVDLTEGAIMAELTDQDRETARQILRNRGWIQ